MATNTSVQYGAAIQRRFSQKVLPIAINYLIAHQFAEKVKLEKGHGVTWTATRFNRLPLPAAPLSEGVAPSGETLNISQVTGVALQWGDKITLSDVAIIATMFDLLEQSKRLLGVQVAETHERNTFALLVTGTQVNYENSKGSRAALALGDVLSPLTVNRTFADLENLGAPFYNGQVTPNVSRGIETGATNSEKGPRNSEHFVAICSPFVEQDLRQNPSIADAWARSDITRLYINEIGYWGGIHFVKSNMLPRYTGIASVTATGAASGGALANATYAVQVTGTDTLNRTGESQIYQVQTGVVVGGAGAGSITLTTPATAGFTYSVYISQPGVTTIANLGLSTAGPTSGLLSGQATQINPSTAITITGIGINQIAPAAPATGVTVYPTFVFGSDYFACLELENIQWFSLSNADKSDALNQLRIIGWKYFEGYVIKNQQFGCRIESSVSNTGTFG